MQKPRYFFEYVVRPNADAFNVAQQDERAAVNVILSIDAFYGGLFRFLWETRHPSVQTLTSDDQYRDVIAAQSGEYRILRDMAAAIKHGELDEKRKKVRLVRKAEALEYRGAANAEASPWDDVAGMSVFIETVGGAMNAVPLVENVMRYAEAQLEHYGI